MVVVVDAIMTCVRETRLCLSCVRGRRLKPLAGRLGGIRKGLSTQSIRQIGCPMAAHTEGSQAKPYSAILHDITNLTDSSTLTHFRFLRRCRRASPHLSLWKLFEWSRRRHRQTVTSKQQTNKLQTLAQKHDGAVRPAKRTAAVLLLLLSCFHEHKVSQSTAVVEKVAAWYACNHRRADGYGAG